MLKLSIVFLHKYDSKAVEFPYSKKRNLHFDSLVRTQEGDEPAALLLSGLKRSAFAYVFTNKLLRKKGI